MSELKLPAASGGGSISIKGPASSGSDVDLLDTSGNLNVSGDVDLADNKKVKVGTGDDLQIQHDGTQSIIETNSSATKPLHIKGDPIWFYKTGTSELFCKMIADSAVELYHDGVKVFETHANGFYIKGPEGGDASVYLYADEGDDNADKWRIVSTTGGELHFENKASGSWEDNLKLTGNGGVELYFDNDLTFKSVSGGTQVPASRKIYVGAYNNHNGFANFSDGSGTATLYVGNQSITTSSDQRLKTDIVNTALNATTKLKQVRVVDFKWNDPSDKAINNRNSRGVWTGTLAQEVVNIFPYVVNAPRPDGTTIDTEDETTWGMEYQHLVPVLIKGFQEQQAEIEILKAKVAALEAE